MMRIRLISLLFLLFFLSTNKSFAYDWKSLHENYEKISLEESLDQVKKDPTSIEKQYMLLLNYLKIHKNESAEQVIKNILKIDPDHYGAQWGLGEIARRRHQYDKSIPILEKIIKENPDFALPYISLALIKYMRLDFIETSKLSAAVFKRGIKIIDLNSLVKSHGIYAASKGMLIKTGNPIKKTLNFFSLQRHISIAKKLDPDSFTALMGDGSYYMAIPSFLGRDLDKAEKFFKKAIEKDPFYPDPYIRIAQIYLERGDKETYQKYLDKAYAIDPKNEVTLDVINGTCIFICIEDLE